MLDKTSERKAQSIAIGVLDWIKLAKTVLL